MEDKIRVARESFATDETVASVPRRHGIWRYRLSSWRSLLRRGKLVAPSSAQAGPAGAFAAVEVEERPSVVIEGGGVTVRLEGGLDGAGIAAIAASGDSTPTIGPFPGPLRQSQAESQVA